MKNLVTYCWLAAMFILGLSAGKMFFEDGWRDKLDVCAKANKMCHSTLLECNESMQVVTGILKLNVREKR